MAFRVVGLLTAFIITLAGSLQGQRVAGPGEDALVLPRGVAVLRGVGDWQLANQWYGKHGLEAIGARWTLDTIGVAQLPLLRPLQSSLRNLSGVADLNLSIGQTLTRRDNRISSLPLGVSMGLTRRLTVGVTVPIVQTMSNVFFSVSPGTNKGNIALNPALQNAADFAGDTAFINQMQQAATAVAAYCTGSGAGSAECTSGAAMASEALTFAQDLGLVYPSALFVPLTGSDVQTQIDTRAAAYRNALNAFASIPGSGVSQITATGVTGATLPVSTTDLRALVMDPALGIQSDSIASMSRWSLGDIEVGAKFLVFDSYRGDTAQRRHITNAAMQHRGVSTRVSMGGMLRIPTGRSQSANDFFDIAAGTGAWGVGIRGYADLLVGPRFWTSVAAKYDVNFARDQERRVSDTPEQVFLPAFRRLTVSHKPGNLLEFEVSPRWIFNDFMSISVHYSMRNKAEDRYTGATVTVGPDSLTGEETIVIDPRTLGTSTEFTEHRFGGGFAFSNLRAYQAGKARIPFEVMYSHSQTIRGSGGYLPKTFTDRIQLRLYWRLLGN